MTPSALAHAVGVTEGAIRQMETGHTKSASFIVGLEIAEVLGVDPWLLAAGSPRRKPAARSQATPSLEARVARLEEKFKAAEITTAARRR
jgi:DNA-binding XRE family transcriptional regulator